MTINIDQARKLHELGVRKNAREYYGTCRQEGRDVQGMFDYWDLDGVSGALPAYNTEELIGMLKTPVIFSISNGYVTMQADTNGQITYLELAKITLTEALANKLIYDIENGITTIEEVNK